MPRLSNPPTSTSVQTAPWVLVPSKHARWPRLLLTPGGHAVGTGAGMTVRLEAAGLAECHAIVQVAEDGVTLEACDPRTWINDGVVRRSKLRLGDRVTLGPCTWTVRSAETDDLLAGWPAPVAVTPPTDSNHRLTFYSPQAAVPGPASTAFTEPSAAIRDESEEYALDTTGADLDSSTDLDSSDEAAQSTPNSQGDFETLGDPLVTLDQAEGLLASCASADVGPCTDQPDQPCATGSASGLPGEHPPNLSEQRSPIDTAKPDGTPSVHDLLKLHDQLQGLRHDLARARAAWREETQRRELELVAESTQLTRRAAAIERIEHELNRRTLELDAEQSSLTRRDGELHQTELRLQELQRELIAERQRLESLAAETQRQLRLETDQQVVAWEECRQSQQRLLAELAVQTSDLEARQAQWRADRVTLAEDQRELELARHDWNQSRQELDAERTAFAQERSSWETRCREREATHLELLEHLRQQQATLNTEIHARAEAQAEMLAAQQTLHHDRRLFAEQQLAWQQERETLWQDLTDRKRRLDRETDELESTRRQIDALQRALEVELDEAKRLARSVSADTAVLTPLAPLTDTPPSSEASVGTIEDAATDPSISQDFDAVQAALEALAERFEEFSELEQRLSNKHDELRDLQQDLAVREAALATETEAWRQEHDSWQTAVAEDAAQRAAWQAERDFATRELAEERRRWADHLQQLGRLATVEPIQDGSPRITLPSPTPVAETMVGTAMEESPVESRSLEAPTGARDDDGVLSEPASTPNLSSEFPTVDDGSSVTEEELTAWRSFEDVIAAEAEWLPTTEQSLATADAQELTPQEVAEAPFEDAEGTARWPMGLSSTADAEPEYALTETGDTTSASAPPASEVNLRAELARMFNLPNDFAEHPLEPSTDSENAESDHEVVIDGSSSPAAALEPSTDDAVADQASSQEDESWRDRLSELLSAKAEAAPEPIVEPEPTPAPVAESVSSFNEPPAAPVNDEPEEDSIAAYMARMMARNRRGGDDEPEPATVTSREPERRTAAPVSSPVMADVEMEPARREPSTPRKKIDKDATRAELQSFRQVANLSARTALAKHTWRTTKTELTIQTTLAGLCTVGGIAYAIAPLMGSPFAFGPTVGCWLGAGFIGWRASQTLRKLRQWTGSAQDAAVTSGSDSNGSDESVIAEPLPPSEDNPNV